MGLECRIRAANTIDWETNRLVLFVPRALHLLVAGAGHLRVTLNYRASVLSSREINEDNFCHRRRCVERDNLSPSQSSCPKAGSSFLLLKLSVFGIEET